MNRRISRGWVASLVVLGGSLIGSGPAVAQGSGYPALGVEEELRLAMSAGPLSVSEEADVYRLGAHGFERAIEGTNGWACIVVRSARDRSQLAPHCLNPQAVKSVLPAFLLEGELQTAGLAPEEIEAELRRRWDSGALELPSGPAYAYMLSEGQRLGENAGNFRPHFMLYVPYATNDAIGADPSQTQFGFVGPYENHPLSTVVILMEEFVSPASVTLPQH